MKSDEFIKAGIELMKTAEAAYLTLIAEDGYPCTRGMLNLRNAQQYPDQAHLYEPHQDDFMVYFSTNTSSNKVR